MAQYDDGQKVEGWVTITHTTEDGNIVYGPFPTKQEAERWLSNLISGEVRPIYTPAFNRG